MCQPAGRRPRGGEARFAWFGALPEGEIKRVLLACFLLGSHAAGGVVLLLLEVAAAELAVAGVFHHGEIHIAIGGIGGAFGLQFADQAADCIKAAGGPRHAIGGGC